MGYIFLLIKDVLALSRIGFCAGTQSYPVYIVNRLKTAQINCSHNHIGIDFVKPATFPFILKRSEKLPI